MSVSNLFRSLKAESPGSHSAPTAGQSANLNAANAEKHWPLLKSIAPKKWQATPKLEDLAKEQRRSHSVPNSQTRVQASASAPQRLMIFGSEVNHQLANGLTRMLARKSAPSQVVAATSNTVQLASKLAAQPPAQPATPLTARLIRQTVAPADDSIFAVLQRLEAGQHNDVRVGVRPTGFLSRLGRR